MNVVITGASAGNDRALGLKPDAVHLVRDGQGPVDVLCVRVPGGRGDKKVVMSTRN